MAGEGGERAWLARPANDAVIPRNGPRIQITARAWKPGAAVLIVRMAVVLDPRPPARNIDGGGYRAQTNAPNLFGAFSGAAE